MPGCDFADGVAEDGMCAAGLAVPSIPQTPPLAIVWVLCLLWIFLGVALGSDVFMASIETITSQRKTKTVTINGARKKFHTMVRLRS